MKMRYADKNAALRPMTSDIRANKTAQLRKAREYASATQLMISRFWNSAAMVMRLVETMEESIIARKRPRDRLWLGWGVRWWMGVVGRVTGERGGDLTYPSPSVKKRILGRAWGVIIVSFLPCSVLVGVVEYCWRLSVGIFFSFSCEVVAVYGVSWVSLEGPLSMSSDRGLS